MAGVIPAHYAGYPVRLLVDPEAREGVDFIMGEHGQVVWLTRDKLHVITLSPEQTLEALRQVAEGEDRFVSAVAKAKIGKKPCPGAYSEL